MKSGDLCRCISNFNASLPGEISLCKNDVLQIKRIIDKLWVEGRSGESYGRFPISKVVKIDKPIHPPGTSLYVAVADFHPLQSGDLPLVRGAFVIGSNSVDKDWGYGECNGSSGVFPFNYIWKVDEESVVERECFKEPVSMIGKVLKNIEAQLPEEISLSCGDLVKITEIVDADWYSGECGGQKGIFPSSFVEIIDRKADFDSVEVTSNQNSVNNQASHLATSQPISNSNSRSPSFFDNKGSFSEDLILLSPVDKEVDAKKTNLTSFNNTWKDSFQISEEEILSDDYFKVNMPSFYTGPDKLTCMNNSDKNRATSDSSELLDDAFSYTYSKPKNYIPNCRSEVLIPLNEISTEIDDYFHESEVTKDLGNSIHEDLLDIDFGSSYTEDNTGINPYGRAVFSFTAKFSNELSFRKGDVIHIIRHLDSHWTVGKLGIAKGIFPTSYIDIIVDCPFKAEDVFEKKLNAISLKKAIVCFDYTSDHPEDVSAKEGDIVLVTSFLSENWVQIETICGAVGMFPLSYLNILVEEEENVSKDLAESSALKTTRRMYGKDDFKTNKTDSTSNIDNILFKNIDLLDTSCKHSKIPVDANMTTDICSSSVSHEGENPCEDMPSMEVTEHKLLTPKVPSSDLPRTPPPIPPRNDISKCKRAESLTIESKDKVFEEHIERHYSSVPTAFDSQKRDNLSRQTTLDIQDVENITSTSGSEAVSALSPRRPAPPRPIDSQENELEHDYDTLPPPEDCVPFGSSIENKNVSLTSTQSVNTTNTSSVETDQKISRPNSHKKLYLRRESISELVTTEHEYIHDLESLVQVIKISKNQKEFSTVDLKILMGNIDEVIALSKKFLSEISIVSFNDDEDAMIGSVFVKMADEMCNVYKVYSSNNSISVGPLLKKYQETGGPQSVFLNWVLTELRQHKVNLLDMQAVLIKPVQRVLKYPLFIDNLVQNTPPTHPDFRNLEEARIKMLNVAKEINDYTKRLDLVNKYRHHSSPQSFGEKIQRVSMRAVAKKSSRLRTRISATMGFINKTKDVKFSEEESKFKSLIRACSSLKELSFRLAETVHSRHRAELGMMEATAAALLKASNHPQIESARSVSRDACNTVLPTFEYVIHKRILEPIQTLLTMCSGPERLILKRADKLLDYDEAQRKSDKNKDPMKSRILEEELKEAKGIYEALNKQLIIDLPILNDHGTQVFFLALKSLISARMNMEGRVAKLYLNLAQSPPFSYFNSRQCLQTFSTDFTSALSSVKKLSFVPNDFSPKSPKVGLKKGGGGSKGKDSSKKKANLDHKVSEGENLSSIYPESSIYVTICEHLPDEQFELSLPEGVFVGVIKMKDPSGSSSRWFVDAGGDKKGFVRSNSLRLRSSVIPPSTTSDIRRSNAQPSALLSTRSKNLAPQPQIPVRPPLPPASVTLPIGRLAAAEEKENRALIPATASGAAENVAPPKYEDLFPLPNSEGGFAGILAENFYEEIDEVDTSKATTGSRYEYIDNEDKYDLVPEDEKPAIASAPVETPPKCLQEKKQVGESQSQFYYALYDFDGSDPTQLGLYKGQVVLLHLARRNDWWFVENRDGQRGYVPASYLEKYE